MAVTKEETETGSTSDLTSRNASHLSKGTMQSRIQAFHRTAEDDLLRRERRLMKNREAARECRRKKKEYVKCLENRVTVLERQIKCLMAELKALKDIYRHKDQ